jgi:hypothetical protein
MPKNLELIPFVDEMIESFVNGNGRYVLDAISRLPKKQSMAAAAYFVERVPDERSRSKFLLALERNADL